jgi:hypothetical protein
MLTAGNQYKVARSCPCCLTDAVSHYRITVALSKKQVTSATPE